MDKEVSISTSTILKIIGILAAVWFVVIIRDIVMLLIFAIILTSTVEPIARKLEKRKISRVFSVSVIYALTIAIFGAVLFFLTPPIIEQLRQLILEVPNFVNALTQKFEIIRDLASQYNLTASLEKFIISVKSSLNMENIFSSLFATTKAFVSGIIAAIIIFAVSFYMSVEKGGLKQFINALIPKRHSENVMRLVNKSQDRLGKWVKGQLVVIAIVGLLDYIGLLLLGVRYALLLGILGAALEIIPYAGPIIATIFAILIGLAQAPIVALFAGLWFWTVQQIENHIITPKVMHAAVGLNPIVVILAILIGAKVAGVPGFILAVPVAAVLEVFISEFVNG